MFVHFIFCCVCGFDKFLCTVNREIFMLKIFHAIIFRVKIFSCTSRPYENILTTKIFLQQKFGVQRYMYVETHGRAA